MILNRLLVKLCNQVSVDGQKVACVKLQKQVNRHLGRQFRS